MTDKKNDNNWAEQHVSFLAKTSDGSQSTRMKEVVQKEKKKDLQFGVVNGAVSKKYSC